MLSFDLWRLPGLLAAPPPAHGRDDKGQQDGGLSPQWFTLLCLEIREFLQTCYMRSASLGDCLTRRLADCTTWQQMPWQHPLSINNIVAFWVSRSTPHLHPSASRGLNMHSLWPPRLDRMRFEPHFTPDQNAVNYNKRPQLVHCSLVAFHCMPFHPDLRIT